ncbi:tetratricopeptide repeat-containing hybrid sensor histidine kinase/response regulator [Aquimarina sediminis]|uniref:tetratricopeptide repeat-containing hybrid sensor histidine kinase/response regulator n=1 Tax=Aquimarina sediminis TaxID=2070536 RepID=UPI0013E8BF8F|nr:response regulator [Aquimarina sediminis]
MEINATPYSLVVQSNEQYDKVDVLIDSVRSKINTRASYQHVFSQISQLKNIARKTKDTFLIARIYQIRGKFQLTYGDDTLAKDYFFKSRALFFKIKRFENVLDLNKDIARFYRYKEKFKEMESLLLESVDLAKKTDHYYSLQILHEIAVFYSYDLQNYKEAIFYGEKFFEDLKYFNSKNITDYEFVNLRDNNSYVISLILGKSYLETEDYEQAKSYLETSEAFYLRYQDNEKLNRIYFHLMTLYDRLGNEKLYGKYKVKFFEVNKRFIKNIELFYARNSELKKQLTKQEHENYVYKIKNEQSVKLAKTQRSFIIILSILSCGLFLLGIYLYQSKKQKGVLNRELVIKNTDLIHAKREKERFFSVLSHELRTPIYSVIELTRMLLLNKNTIDKNKELEAIKYSGYELLSLIDNIVSVNEIDKNTLALNDELFNLEQCVSTTVKSLESTAQINSVKLNYENNVCLSQQVYGDAHKLVQILSNLIRNGIKFAGGGKVKIKTQTIIENKSNIVVHFEIIDDGIGISKIQQHNILNNYNSNKSINKIYGGLGVGLYITQYLLKLYKSEIKIDSDINKGSKFSFDIDFKIPIATYIEKVNQSDTDITVLVVDDNKVNLLVASRILVNFNIKPIVSTDWKEVLEIVKTQKIDAILMDINMPDKDGFEVTKLIRDINSKVPIIAHTAVIDESLKTKFTLWGMNDYIFKPYKPEVLEDVIYRNLFASKVV